MKDLDDILALELLFPKLTSETPIAWISRARASGILNEEDCVKACGIVRLNMYLWIN